MTVTERKVLRLNRALKSLESVLVAFSGGVDSTYLLQAALDNLGPDKVLAVCAVSAVMTTEEERLVRKLAGALGARLKIIKGPEMTNARFLRNDKKRCYWCKRDRFHELKKMARHEGLQQVIEGSNADDIRDYRPGMQAIAELGIQSPLLESGLTKKEIRELSRQRGLPTWNKPAAACLASRIPYGQKIEPALLRKIGSAEKILRKLGFPHVRLRHHGQIARIEVPEADCARLLEPGVKKKIISGIKKLGWVYVTLDLEGYTTGSLNRVIPL